MISKRSYSAEQNYTSNIHELRNIGLSDATLEILADADAFRSIDLDRRQALWEVSVKDHSIALFKDQLPPEQKQERMSLPAMKLSEHVVCDYAVTSLSLKAHPVSFIREKLQQLHIISANELTKRKNGDRVKVAGLVLVKQRPGTASGICFMTIEDETGIANLVIFENLFKKYRKEVLQSKLIMVDGKLQVEGEVIHVIAECCYDFSRLLRHLTSLDDQDQNVFPAGRNFR